MVSFTSLAVASLAAVGALAAPTVDKRWSNSECLTAADAQQVADNYAELIRNYSDKLAKESLAKDFTDYSESVNSLINTCPQGSAAKPLPLLSASFSNRKQFMVGQGQQPAINFKQLNLEYNCNFVTIRWMTTNTAPIPKPRPVVGIILLQVEKAPEGNKYPWIISTVYSEFDSGAWLQNLEEAGICSVSESGSPTIILPSGTVGTPPASSAAAGSGAPSGYSTPASAPASVSVAPASSGAAQPSESCDESSATASATATSSWAASSAPAYSSATTSSAPAYSSAAASSAPAYSASAYTS